MKKKLLRCVYIAFFFAFSITLFSVESEKEKKTVGNEVEGAKKEAKSRERSSLNEDASLEKKRQEGYASNKKSIKEGDGAMSSAKTSNTEDAKGMQEGESGKSPTKPPPIPQEAKPQEPQEQKKEETVPQNADFSSIQVTGLTIASDGKWYFEEYDEAGNIISKISYNKNKMISASAIQYSNGKRSSERITEGKKIINVKYNSKGEEIGREELKSKKNGETVPIASSDSTYADDGKIKEESKTENGITTRRVYTYDKDKKTSETVYENGVQTLFIEYKDDKKVVHIFDEGKEVSVFTEDIEGGH